MRGKFPHSTRLVVHCRTRHQAEFIADKIKHRLQRCGLSLSPEKTKIVYCKDSNRNGRFIHQSFDFLGYTFRPRSARDQQGRFFVSFSPEVSRNSLKKMRRRIKEHPMITRDFHRLEGLAQGLNPVIQGWINYYGTFTRSAMSPIYNYINMKVMKWLMRKHKRLRNHLRRTANWLRRVAKLRPLLFAHWKVWKWVAE